MSKKKIGDRLIERNIITQKQLDIAIEYQKKSGEKIANCLVSLGFVKTTDILPILAEQVGFKPIDPKAHIDSIKDLIRFMPKNLVEKGEILPIKKDGIRLVLGMIDPFDVEAIDEVQMLTNMVIMPVLLMRKDIFEILARINMLKNEFENGQDDEDQADLEKVKKEFVSATNILEDLDTFEEYELEKLVDDDERFDTTDQGPIIAAVDKIISHAIAMKASDIHIEPFDDELRVRFRVDGVLQTIKTFPKIVARIIAARIKIMSDLNIAERRLPQDGRIKLKIKIGKQIAKEVDFRVSIMPTIYGEKVVMRILDGSAAELTLEDLGMVKSDRMKLERAIEKPYGMILITGPTGSGKSTTLYSVLQKLNHDAINISTAEDPVEFRLKGANQVMCKESIGLTFASVLRSFLRQDPDVIMVGEIRDEETAGISVKAALTGHLLLSTLHTNDAPSTIQRLLDMGIESYLLSSSLILIQAQRLARKVCKYCKEVDTVTPESQVWQTLGLSVELYSAATFYKGKGCTKCNGTGYKGRVGFYEVLEISDEIRSIIKEGVTASQIREIALKQGLKTLRDDGLDKAIQGLTTLEEVLRVTIDSGS